jgi:arsenate reductase (thioredoxin)
MSQPEPTRILFLCTYNSARSIMAEAVLNHLSQGRFMAYSAGSQPQVSGQPHPMALEVLNNSGISTLNLRSKSWDEFSRSDAPAIDLVITLCDTIHQQPCPEWPGKPASAHWSYPDPASIIGSDQVRMDGFRTILLGILRRIGALVNIPLHKINKLSLQTTAQEIEMEYTELHALLQRTEQLFGSARKTDLIRAGINMLNRLNDDALVAEIEAARPELRRTSP